MTKSLFDLGVADAYARGLTGRAARRYAFAFERRQLRRSPPPHAHPRNEAPVLAHEARGAVGDEEREPEQLALRLATAVLRERAETMLEEVGT